MGDGGVVFMPSQHVMERLPISTSDCRGSNGGGFSLKKKSMQFKESQQQQRKHEKNMSVEKEEFEVEKDEVEEGELHLGVENGEFIPEKREVEKGEFFVPDRWRREVEKGEFIPDKRRKGEVEKEEFGLRRGWKNEVEKGEFVPDRWRKKEADKLEFSAGRGRKGELEKGEITPDKWRKRDENGEYAKEKAWASARDRDHTSPSTKFTESGSESRRRSSIWEPGYSRDSKNSLRSAEDELGSAKYETGHRKDYSSGGWLKKHVNESGNSAYRYHADYTDHPSSKTRRLSGDVNVEKYRSHSPMERSSRNYSSSHASSVNRYSSRHDPSLSSRRTHDRHAGYFDPAPHDRARFHDHRDRSPSHFDRSPHDQARYHDHRNRSPARQKSPHPRARQYDRRDRTPGYMDKSTGDYEHSPVARSRYQERRDRTPGYLERSPDRDQSPHVRTRHHDHRDHTPGHLDRSPLDCDRSPLLQARRHDHRDRTPSYLDRSPRERGRPQDHYEASRKSEGSEAKHSQNGSQGHEEKLGHMSSVGKDTFRNSSSGQSHDNEKLDKSCESVENSTNDQSYEEEQLQNVSLNCTEPTKVDGAPDELLSMEEDMDISPPHAPVAAESTLGSWFYLDHFGVERGPSRLCDLKRLVEEGVLQSDHLIKHSGSDWWLTVENAASPLVEVNFPSIVSDTVTQLVSPPEAPGNLLVDNGDIGQSANQPDLEQFVALPQLPTPVDDSSEGPGNLEDFRIDDRVTALLEGYSVIEGRELETLGEALNMMFEHKNLETWGNSEGLPKSQPSPREQCHRRQEESSKSYESTSKELAHYKDYSFQWGYTSDWFSGRWSCKGGDWKRHDESVEERSSKRKFVLNDGYPLCQMSKSGYEDPRWRRKDELYYPSRVRKLNLPPWAFSLSEERADCNGTSRSNQIKQPLGLRGVKGTILPVVRINTCVVNDRVPPVTESCLTVRAYERHSSRSVRPPSSSDGRSTLADDVSQSRSDGKDLEGLQKCIEPIIIPKDHVCSANELQLHLGDWYYLDGAGHEHGPSTFRELHVLVENGTIQKHTSVFRKFDNIWVPVSYADMSSKVEVYSEDQKVAPVADSRAAPVTQSDIDMHDMTVSSSSFHNLHPQFIGYTRGKLHELVMKSYKSREFAAAINEVLDPWINAKQPKKELEKHSHNSCLSQDMQKFRRSEDGRAGKRARVLADDSEDDYDLDRDLCSEQKDDCLFEDLCGDVTFVQEKSMQSGSEDSWGLMNGHILARVFHFLRTDTRSLSFSAATCRHWNAAVMFYRDISKQVDLSDAGPNCTDSMFRKIMNCYNKTKITSIILIGCTNISATALEEILLSLPSIYSIDIRGCSQFRELSHKFQNIKWIMSHTPRDTKIVEDSGSKIRSLKQIADKGFSLTKAFKGTNSNLHGDAVSYDYALDSKDSEIRSLGQSFYKTKKLFDARKPTSFLPTDPRMRRWLYRKSENGYRKLEEFLSVSLKDIMKENTFEFFVPKVAEIEDKMKNGYYMGHGLTSVKEDISRMCRDAIKAKNRGGMGDMNRMITLFIHLATSLDESSKSSRERDEMGKMSTASIYKKKHSKTMNEGKSMNRSNGQFYGNGGAENGEYASDREIRRRLAKLNKRPLDSESETSDDLDRSSEEPGADGDSTASDTESDPDLYSEVGIRNYKRDDYLMEDHPFDSMTEDREWGARMTKASLVPPVTRKYEVIDRYVVITDEDDVQRKMRVALPEDYVEKLSAHKNGTEESDVDIPIVKDYKPRKQLGEEVLEQEVYGIDPYTHNLLLDSMPEELDWSLLDKHLFIENELLSTLNTQVRDFTGTGNAPMKYSLQPVVEEIHRTAEKHGDKRILKMCHGILKAMRSRPEDNYVAYRKGLGVVCNREEGFGEDDFVVEFLGEVYPAWKWFEKQDGIRSLQKNTTDPATEFYNIYLERPKGDRDGYDLVVVDAMHKANYASRICHSCRPNCEAKVTAVDGQYQIGVYSVRPIGFGEEITFDYNSVTESKEEYEASVCLCGSQICRGSYLNLTGEGAYQKVISERHGMLHRHQLMLEACQLNFVSEEDYFDLRKAGVGTCLLSGLPDWLVAYAARVVRFINYERTKLPDVILNHNLEEKRKYFADICLEVESNDAQVQAEGVYNQRLQNLALTLDKVRYVMRCVYTDSKKAPPPLEKLNTEEIVSVLWKGEGSLVEELLQCIAPHTEDLLLKELRSKIHDHEPSASDLMGELRKSLIWLRDEIRNLPCTYKCRHDAAADLIHLYAYTKCFFRVHEYKKVTSSPVYISPLDLGPKYMDKLGSGFKEYCKTYGEDYCLGQLIFWHTQNNADPDCNLVKARRGCLLLPDIASFYGKAKTSSKQRVYGPRTVKFMLSRMEKQPQKPWPEERIWTFKSTSRVFGSPMLDAVVNKTSINKEMIHWLKKRPAIFQAMWDR